MANFSPIEERPPVVLTVPGLGGSGPSHWQTLWEGARLDTRRAELGMWDRPHRNVWVTKLDQAIRAAGAPVCWRRTAWDASPSHGGRSSPGNRMAGR